MCNNKVQVAQPIRLRILVFGTRQFGGWNYVLMAGTSVLVARTYVLVVGLLQPFCIHVCVWAGSYMVLYALLYVYGWNLYFVVDENFVWSLFYYEIGHVVYNL